MSQMAVAAGQEKPPAAIIIAMGDDIATAPNSSAATLLLFPEASAKSCCTASGPAMIIGKSTWALEYSTVPVRPTAAAAINKKKNDSVRVAISGFLRETR